MKTKDAAMLAARTNPWVGDSRLWAAWLRENARLDQAPVIEQLALWVRAVWPEDKVPPRSKEEVELAKQYREERLRLAKRAIRLAKKDDAFRGAVETCASRGYEAVGEFVRAYFAKGARRGAPA
jgi:hypothetical protein